VGSRVVQAPSGAAGEPMDLCVGSAVARFGGP